jgi:hypothetical protein
MTEEEDPRCPYCMESIRPLAVKCRWCGEFLKRELRLRARLKKRPPRDINLPEPSTILILGLLSLLICGLLGPFALAQGNDYVNKCRALRLRPCGIAVAGRALGIVSCAIIVIQLIGIAAIVLTFIVR